MLKQQTLKLYIWHDVLTDYTSGMVAVLATSKRQALTLLKKKSEEAWKNVLQEGGEPQVVTSPEAFYVWGGG